MPAPDNKPIRTALWGISGKREYPQVFVDGVFQGGMDEIQVCESTPHTSPHLPVVERSISFGRIAGAH